MLVMKKLALLFTIFSLGCLSNVAQARNNQHGQAADTAGAKRAKQVESRLAEAKQHIENQAWRESAFALGKILELGGIPPAEFYFLLGKTFVRGQDYENGKQLLQDYQSITDGKGEFAKQAQALLQEVKAHERGQCQVCAGRGYTEARHKCPTCHGFGFILEEDRKCYGRGYETCRICAGSGRVYVQSRPYTCSRCGGRGEVKCPWCQGSGHVRNPPCETCGRTGATTSQIYCNNCEGDGRIDDKPEGTGETDEGESRDKKETPKVGSRP